MILYSLPSVYFAVHIDLLYTPSITPVLGNRMSGLVSILLIVLMMTVCGWAGEPTTSGRVVIDLAATTPDLYFTPTDPALFVQWRRDFYDRAEERPADESAADIRASLLPALVAPIREEFTKLTQSQGDAVIRTLIAFNILSQLGYLRIHVSTKHFPDRAEGLSKEEREYHQCLTIAMVLPRIKIAWANLQIFAEQSGMQREHLARLVGLFGMKISADWALRILGKHPLI